MSVIKARIRKWFGTGGYGFARPLDAGPNERDRDVFVHAQSLDPALGHLTRLDFPVMGSDNRPDFAASPQWPHVFIEAEPSDKGLRAKRVSDKEFRPGEVCTDFTTVVRPSAEPSSASPRAGGHTYGGGNGYGGSNNAYRNARGGGNGGNNNSEGQRPRREDKAGGGRRGSWGGSRDDDY